ncbi:MAG: DUF3300 domain-containing protein [Povalibacter sp.]
MKSAFTTWLLTCAVTLVLVNPAVVAQTQAPPAPATTAAADSTATQPPAPAFKPEELEQIVAPIALYPDALLAQILMASTYPLEIVEAARWSKEHPEVKGDSVATEMEKQPWDPAVKSLVAFPDVLTMMNEKLDWTQKLGDAFLAQQKGVMDAVQRLRAKAKDAGNLKTTKEQTVKTEPAPAGAATPQIIIVESSSPEVVYVPTYNPTVVYGAWPYPAYPPYYYYPPAYVPGAAFFSFSMGVVVGGALWGGCNWGSSDVDINVNRYNNFNRTDINRNDINRNDINNRNNNVNNRSNNVSNNGKWQHDSSHRKGVSYRDSATQQKYGRNGNQQGVQSREQFRGRAEQGRQEIAREGAGNQRDLNGNQVGTRDNSRSQNGAGGSQNRGNGAGSAQTRDMSASNRDSGGSQYRDLGPTSRDSVSSQERDRSAAQDRSTSQDRSRSSGSSSRSSDAFNGMGNGAGTRANSSRGGASRGGGGGRRR